MNIGGVLETYLSGRLFWLLREVGEGRGEDVYMVGGVVRDLLMGQGSLDVDLVIEGKAIPLARQIARSKNWRVKTHPHFGTAKLYGNDFSLDIATARSEAYARPGALPKVEFGTIHDDLFRRDFTINAMAASLNPESFGKLLDPCGGQSDLEKGIIRVLHPKSFTDDPTRILRALRYEQRFDFHLEEGTESLLRRDLSMMDAVTGERLWYELGLILDEEQPEKVLLRADQLGVLQKLCPGLKGDRWLMEEFVLARSTNDQSLSLPAVYLSLLIYWLAEEESEAFISRLKMPGWAGRIVRETLPLKRSIPSLSVPELRPSEVYRTLERYSPEAVRAAALASESPIVRERLETYLNSLRYVKASLNGEDLKSMGVKQGKKIGQLLQALHDARLNGKVSSREGEEELVRRSL